ncbi:hypothetical protein BDZ90DRAFT_226902 [Jaminaea rosea]|uniref:Uncharacterized protein n=1 Tax=Jaminaea rosea TaxID=1569628 RepID=A0A316UYG8_9BASI|nr:hypothetical protein BDZ90DRAFT_226902 [Jaminaea rosea]PWN28185.1 hypothetical protein BDZ90DRAFT_226902 [Jaminaea rosea]
MRLIFLSLTAVAVAGRLALASIASAEVDLEAKGEPTHQLKLEAHVAKLDPTLKASVKSRAKADQNRLRQRSAALAEGAVKVQGTVKARKNCRSTHTIPGYASQGSAVK